MSQSPVGQNQTPRRTHPRLRLGITARIETLEGQQRVRLMDLSQGGAHLILTQPSDIRKAVLTWLTFEAFGDIVWSDGSHYGITFDKPLPLACLVETRQRAPSVVRDEELGAENAARDWVAGTLSLGAER